MKKQNSQLMAVLMIASMIFSPAIVFAESGRGAADDLTDDSNGKSTGDITDLRGDGTPEDNGNDDSPDLRGDGTPEDDFGDDEFPDLRGDGTLEDNLNDDGVIRNGLEVRAFEFGGISQIKIELGFSPVSSNNDEIIKDAFNRVKQLTKDDVSSALRVRNKIEQLREDSEIRIQDLNGVKKAAVQIRFSLDTDQSSNRDSMINAIMDKLQKLKLEDFQKQVVVEDRPKVEKTETSVSTEKKAETEKENEKIELQKDGKSKTEQETEKAESEKAEKPEKSETKSKGFLGGIADFFSGIIGFIFGVKQNETTEQRGSDDIAIAAKAGIVIDKTLSKGPGYPTGPLSLSIPAANLVIDRVGQVKNGGAEIKDRQYEIEFATIPITINGVANTVNELKIISNLKTKNGAGQHSGTIDVDIDILPAAGHVTLQYSGTATVDGSAITSAGTFKTVKTTGIFAGLVAEGTYTMTIVESGSTFGSVAAVSINTASA